MNTILTAVGALLVARFLLKILQFRTLNKFPGPKIAAWSKWYMAYYDLYLDGAWTHHLEKLHDTYGPVVRVGPNELHFSTPEAFGDIYNIGSKFTKDPAQYNSYNTAGASFGLVDPRAAKTRRDMISPLFSRRSILKFEYIIQEQVDALIGKLLKKSKTTADMTLAFRAISLDIISAYCFGQCFNALDIKGFNHPLLNAMEKGLATTTVIKYFPFFRHALSLPPWLLLRLDSNMKGYVDYKMNSIIKIDDLLEDPSVLDRAEQDTVYHHLMNPKAGKGQQLPRKSLAEEADVLLSAGTDTTAGACAVGTFYVLQNQEIYRTLLQELKQAWPEQDTRMGFEALEKLPYLTAVIKESMRMAIGAVTPLVRKVGEEDAVIAGHCVPAGTSVSTSTIFVLRNPEVFPEPYTFNPERWLKVGSGELDSHLVNFSRGPRTCLGQNLAWAELYLILGNVFRKVNMEIDGTVEDDLKWKAHLIPIYQGENLKVRVMPMSE